MLNNQTSEGSSSSGQDQGRWDAATGGTGVGEIDGCNALLLTGGRVPAPQAVPPCRKQINPG